MKNLSSSGVALLTSSDDRVGATGLETQYVGKVTAPEIEPGWVGTLRVGATSTLPTTQML